MKRIIAYQLFVCALMVSCSTTKNLPEGELLYSGADIEIEGAKNFMHSYNLKKDLEDFTRPEKNDKFLGIIPFQLWFYNLYDSAGEKGFKHWVKYKLGEEPVVLRDYHIDNSLNQLQTRLFNTGYLEAEVQTSSEIKKRKARVNYTVEPGPEYIIDSIIWPKNNDTLTRTINHTAEKSLLEDGDVYKIKTLEEERERIAEFLRNKGFYHFSPEYITFRIDTFHATASMLAHVDLQQSTPARAGKIYTLNKIHVYPNHQVESKEERDTILYKGYSFISRNQYLKPPILARSILLETGDIYRYSDYTGTLNKLMGLGIFKYVNISYNEIDTVNQLNSEIYLTQMLPKNIRIELEAVTKSNDFAGPGINLSYSDRNSFGNAEQYSMNLSGSFETQLSKTKKGTNSWDFRLSNSLVFPKFIIPFINADKYLSRQYTPKTKLEAGFNYLDRVNLFTMNSVDLSFGYNWNETPAKQHDLTPFLLSYFHLPDVSQEFQERLDSNIFLQQSFNEQFILSLRYSYTFNNQPENPQSGTFFRASGEIAGNMLSAINRIVRGQSHAENGKGKLLGLQYSQFVRTSFDTRKYLSMGKKSYWAGRLFLGVGIPYSNSETLPYSRQFFAGGPSGLRSFESRTVGPGSYHLPDTITGYRYIEQSGNIKIETNQEFRFPIYRFLKGAVFVDAGNVWLLDEDKQQPGGKFSFESFLDEMAVGTGLGIRLDISFFVLRLDIGFPVRKPYLENGDRWIFNEIDFSSKTWRNDNLVYNIAIGYPF
ncbi:MAG: BamA/TamA family outer membrane protein [Bacteroidota bacterium]